MTTRTVGILIFDDVEILDFAGPFGVFSTTEDERGDHPFRVVTVAATEDLVTAIGGLRVVPSFTLDQAPLLDVIVIPGGVGTVVLMENQMVIAWLVNRFQEAELVMSVCSGARLLAKAGLLNGLQVTTHHQVIDYLAELAPSALIDPTKRYIDTGRVMTTGGITAGIDGSLYVVERFLGKQTAIATAHYMEYHWNTEPQTSLEAGTTEPGIGHRP